LCAAGELEVSRLPVVGRTGSASAETDDDAAMASDAASAASSGMLGSDQQPASEVPAPPDEAGSSSYLGQPGSDQFDREAAGEAPEAADMALEAASGDEAEVAQLHAPEASAAETDAEVPTDRAAAALAADRDDALKRQPSEDAASLEEVHSVHSAAQDAAAAEHALPPTATHPAKVEPEPPVVSRAPQAAPSAEDEDAAVPPADGMEAALAESDAPTDVASVPGSDASATAPEDAVSAVSDDLVEPPAGGEPAQADSAADIDHPVQPLVDHSELGLESAEAAAEACGPPPPSAEAGAAVEQGIQPAELPDALPTRSTGASEARSHSTTEPPAEGSEDPLDPTADTESTDASIAAVGSTAAGGVEAAEPIISDDVAPNEVDDIAVVGELAPHEWLAAHLSVTDDTDAACSTAGGSPPVDGKHGAVEDSADVKPAQEPGRQEGDVAVVLPERSSAGVYLPDGPSADDVPSELGSRSLSSSVELLPEDNLSANPTMVGASPVQGAVLKTVS